MNVDPAMLRQSAAMMQNMTPEQVKNMTEMASKMYANGQLPPGFAPPPGVAPQPAPKPTAVRYGCVHQVYVKSLRVSGFSRIVET